MSLVSCWIALTGGEEEGKDGEGGSEGGADDQMMSDDEDDEDVFDDALAGRGEGELAAMRQMYAERPPANPLILDVGVGLPPVADSTPGSYRHQWRMYMRCMI